MPNIWRLCLILWCSSLSGLSFASETASFYGASYISVPFQEAKSTTTISFKFRTKRSDAILFLSAGKIDYCLLRLESGRLKVHINLGAGDTEISTPRGLRLDDLLWHSVNVTRIEANVSLTVDLIHTTFEKLPGKFFELNIHYGLFIGGQGDFTELFLGHVDWLRGCMSDVIYNNIDTLKRARARSSQADAQGVLWSCSAEFDSSHDSEISFVDDGAFLSLPQVVQRAGVRLTFDLKTDSISGILVYSSGPMSGGRADFLGLEIVNRRLRLLLDTGNGVLSLTSDLVVSTGEWVSISLVLSPSLVELLIDGHQGGMLKLPNQGTKYLDLADTIYVGGIELNKRARALSQGLKTADVSLKGCVRRLEVDSKPLGLGEAKVSSGLLAECVWSFPCHSSPPPCTSLTPCTQLGVASSSCECSGGSCANPEFNITNPDRTPLAVALEIIRLEPLTVSEGENTLLTSVHISLVLDAARYGVRESGVMFHIRSPPSHGTLHLEIWEHDAHSGQMFTLLDLAKDKVRYIHDGSESRLDSFDCELALSPGPGFLLPPYLQGRHWFRFHIQITPVNDPPTLTIPTGKVLRLAQGTRKTLTPDLLLAQDLDSPPASLVIRVNESHAERGHLERLVNGSSKSGDPEHQTVTAFTMEELTAGLVQYVHSGGEASGQSNYKLALQVSDGVASSNIAYLNIAVYPLELRRENNTGVLLIHNSHTLITSANLSFVINSDDTEVVIVYKITTPPLFGSLQTLKVDHSTSSSDSKALSGQAGDNWQSASEFTDAQIRRSQVRYLHREGTPGEDAFKFTVSLRPTPPTTNDNSPPYTFSIHFVQLTLLGLSNPRTWFDSHSRELLLTPMHLSYDTSPLPVPPNTIVYKISRPLRYGNLSRRGNSAGLSTGDVFTQAEINTGELYYSLHRTTYSNVTDTMEFTVSAPHCDTLSDRNLSFVYTPDVSLLRKLTVTISNLQVVEGGQERLSGGIVCHGVSSLSYEVTLPPRYGGLDLTEAVTSKKIVTRNITRFSGTQLSRSLIMYTHDDSESKTDRMEYVAISSDKEDFQYIGSISVSVALTNDNAPRRSANQSLEVVLDSSHLLLPSHLSYADEDMDATGHNIIYSVRSSQGGALYSAVSPLRPLLPLADFSQADIDSGRVKYRHQSNLSDTTVLLRVSDGAHFVEGVLHVHASAPYVRVVNSTRLIVKEGGEAVLTPEHLSCETNVDMNPAQIKYDILEYPSYGEIQFRKPAKYSDAANSKSTVEAHKRGDLSITSFSQRDIMAGSLVYVQNGALGPGHSIKRDVFKLRLDAGDQAWNDTLVLVSIYPALYYTGLVRTRNETLLIEESTGFVISRQSLLIEQPGVAPGDIVYHVTQGPAYGYLELDPPLLAASNGDSVSSDPVSVAWFDQQAINDERLHYVQAGGQNRTQDFFLLDVTNGILWIRGLQVNIIIVPEHIYLSSGDSVSVDEGGNITLLPSLLPLLSPYYQNRVTEYRVIRQSKHGALYFSSNKVAIMRWTPQQLQAGQIQYIHDGSESGNDSFTLVARARDKESNPATVNIIILPVNDQVPHVKNNTGVVMYRGATVTLTNDNLACVDLDTAPENITYTVPSSHHGHLALKSGPAQIIHNFTQAQINSGTVVFTHLGDESATAGFEATVSDSLHSTSAFSFLITTLTPRLVLARAHGLSVFPMLSKVISSNELAAWSSDKERSVLYVVTQLPSHGFLHVNDKAAYELPLNFTQADVNNSRVSYQHSSPFRDPDLNDTFRFNVFADFTEPVLNKTFPIHISVSYGGLESLVTPHISLAVIEGGTSPIQLNTSAIVAFLSERVGLHSPTLSLSLLVEPSHGAVCECKNNEHNRRKAKREIGERNLHIGNRDQEEEGGVAGLSEGEHIKRSVKREIEELSGHNLNRDYEELAAGVLNVNGGSRSRWDLKRVEEDVGDLNEVNENGKPRNTAREKSVGDLSALVKLDTELGDLKHDDVDGESVHRPRVKREVEESIRHADALTDVSRSNDNVRQLSDAHRFQRDKRKSFDLEYENNRLSGDPSVRQTLDLTNSVYSNKPNEKSNASARYTDRSSQSSLESEYPLNSEDQRLLDSEEKRNQEYLRQYEAYYNRRAQEQRYRNSQERNGQNSHERNGQNNVERNSQNNQDGNSHNSLERTSQNQSNHNRMSQREQNRVRETIYGRDKSVDRNPDRITGDDKYSKFVEPRHFQPSQTQEGVQMRGDAENLEVEPGQFGSDEHGTDDRKDNHWPDGNGRNIPNSRHSENGEQTNGTSRAADDHGSVRETHVTNDETFANNNIGRQSAEKSRGQNSPGVQSGNSPPSSENSLEQISGAARTSNEWTQGDSDRVRTNEFAKRNKAKSGGNVPARGNWEAPVSEKGGVLANEASIPLSQSQCSKDSGLLYFYDSVNLCYHHDHSDSLSDSLTISIYLYPGDVLLTNVSVDIVVSPINDQPFVLRTLKPHVNVVQGHEVRLTARDLYTEDNDTSPADIVYEIITQPTVGYIKIVDPELIAVGKSGVQRRSVDGQSEDEEESNSHVDTLSHTEEEVKSDDDQDVKPDSEKVRIETTDSDTRRSSVDNTKTIPSKEKVILDDTTNLRERSIGLSDSVHDTNTSVEEEKKNNVIQTNVQRTRFQRDINVMNDIPVSRHAQNYASNFTQQDVNTGRVVYVHNSNNTGTISFYFRVHDGKFNPVYNLFNINIVPIRLSIDIKKPVPIRQTDSLALIPASIFSIQSNLNSYAHLRFLVTRPPINGHIYVSEKKADSFSYSDLEAGNVLYMQTNMASFADMLELECDVLNLVTLEKLFVNITVEPLVNVTKFEPVAGLRNKISSEILNVDLLAALSNANPLFKIIKKPRYGKIKKIIRSTGGSGDLRESEIARFTYDQLRHGQVYYVASGKLNASSTDCFVYLLNASVYQPAIGEFCFRVAIQATPALNSPKSRINNNYNNNMELSSPNISNDYALIVAMIAAVILLSVVIVFIVRMRSKRLVQRKKSALQDTAGDHVVKSEVTPTSQPVAMRGMIKYPYGAVEQEEEEPSEGVPPLRRNQYWVVEGGQERLSGGIVCHGVSSLSYEVTLPPRYGALDLTEAVTNKKIVTRNITRFSGTQLSRSLIMYTHDDSESKTDRMEYVAISSDKEDFQYIGSISVSVALTNDNAPRRSANQSLEVVLDSSHLLLPSHLSYADEDMDATGHNIIYSVRSSQGGALYSAVSPLRPLLPLADFSQADIDSGRVKYRHQSNLSDTTVLLRVSDGAHFVEGVLHVHASAPYVRVVNSTRLIVKEGGEAVLTPEHLSCETNVDMNPAQIKYDILEYPSYGEIQFRKPAKYSDAANSKSTVEAHKRGDLSITSFSQRDVMAGSLVYVQNGALGPGHSIKRDVFKLRLDAGDQAWNDTLVLVSIYPALYYTGLVRTRNETLLIEESTGFVISRQSLLIEQPGVAPSDIVYHVTQGPAYGYLELDPPLLAASNGDSVSSDPVSVAWFDQQAINDERLHYVQAGGQNRTQDFFLLDVTNGILWIRGLQVNIIIVPEHIYLSSGDSVSVDEGGNITLLPSLLPLLSPYYQNRVTEYRVIRQSKHGALYFSSNKVAIMRWTPQQLQAGQIQYIHDGSESGNDSFTLVARAGDKESNPATVNIIILPVNDQVPHVKNNTGVVMYRGATVTLTNDNLACVDLDTAPENLTYTVPSSHHGHLALKSGPAQIIHNFTQAQINSGTVVFTHLGDEAATAGFEATVSDSLHSTSSFSFLITTLTPRLVLARAHGLSVFPMLSKVISSNELAAWSSDKERSVLYVVTQLPSHGFLHVNDKAAYELPLNFTQADVNNSRVSYQHSSPFRDPDLNDTFRFNVFADFTEPVLNKTFPIHISVSYGGLESLVTPHISLAVIEGGTSPIQLNTSAIVAFLSERVGLHSPTLSLSLLVEPSHGAVCECKNNEHNRRKAKREIGERSFHIGNRDQEEEEGGVAGLSEGEHIKRSVKREIEELSGHNLNRDYEELAAGVLNVNGGSRSRWDLKRVEEDVGDSNEVNEHSKPRNTAREKSVGDLSALEKLDTELGDLKHDDVDGESAHRPRVKREVEESIRHADALTDVSRSNDSVRQLSDAHRFQRDKRKSFDLEYENNRLSGDPSVRQTLDLTNTNSVYSNKPNKKSNASARYTDRSSQSSLESEYPLNSEDQRLLDSEEKRNQEYLRQYEAYYNRRAQEQRYRNSQERNGQNSHERTRQNQNNHDRMSQREQNGVRETIYGRDKSVDRNPERITGDDKYSKFVEPRHFQPSQTQEGVQMRGDAENLEVEPGQFGSDEHGTDDRKDNHWPDRNGRNIPNSRYSENSEQTNGTSRAADDHGSVRETHVTNDENLANNIIIGRQSAEKSRGQNSPGVQSGNSPPSSENSLEQISGAARTSNEWTRGDSDRVRTNEFAKRNKAKSGGNVPARGNWEAPVSEKGGVLANEASIPLSQSQCSKDSGLLYFYDSVNLCYHHDHSDSLSDSLTISIYLYPGDVLLTNVSVDIVVSPINDQPFVLRTLKPHVNVVQGHEVRLTARDLYTEDNDTSPADIVYEIITQPTVGYIKIVDPELIAVGKSGVQRRSVDGQSEDEEEFTSHVDTLSHTKEEVKSDDDQDVKPDSEKVRIETTDSDTRRSSVDNTKTIPSKEKVILDDTTNLRERSIGLSDSVHDTNTSVEEEKKNNVIQTNVQRTRFQRDINVMNDIPVSRHAQNYASNFTQQDVNTGRVVYVHNSNNTGTISFYFRVHDGKFNPVYNLFNINIVPIRLSIDIKKPVPIRQTDSLALIPASIFSIQSNLNSYAHLRFLVTRPPINGHIYVSEKKADSFSYSDLEAGNVLYMQTNMASFADMLELECDVLNLVTLEKLFVNITVEPLVNVTKFEPVAGLRNKISSEILNVDLLAALSNANPLFKIIKKPRYGKIKKIIRSTGGSGDLRESEIARFTYDQLRHGQVYYVASGKLNASSTDCFVYLLNASVYQPAIGEFCFRVAIQATPALNSPKSRINNNYNNNMELSSPNISNDYALIVAMIAAVILLSVVIVFIVRMRSKRLVQRKKSALQDTAGDHVVKSEVTPTSQPVAMRGMIKYPYGAVEQEEEEPSEGVPPLRRNQYWV